MPTPRKTETKEDWINRCMGDQESIDTYPDEDQRFAVCSYKWEQFEPIKHISFDYDGVLTTKRGMDLALKLRNKGHVLYIISARQNKVLMRHKAEILGIPMSKIYATGSNPEKIKMVLKLKTTHYDNNPFVVRELGKYGKLLDKFSKQLFQSYDDYPKAASENAQIALRWAEENGWGSCGTAVGKARANQLAKGESISEDTISRMASFERHRQNSTKELGDGCGRLMWLAWGGDEGIEWAQRKLEQIRNGK